MHVCLAALLLLGLFCGTQGLVGAPCTDKSNCAADECCQIINIIVASKRRQLPPQGSGTCQPYKQQGEHCDGIAVMNGFCGCAGGLTCRVVYVGTKRSPLAPGYASLCLP